MGLAVSRALRTSLLLVAGAAALAATPLLRLSSTTVGPVSTALAVNGPTQTVEAFNAGDGALSLRLTASATWAVPTLGAARACTTRDGGTCLPLQIALQTTALARGTHTATVTVADPNAADAPQTITVTVQVGGGIPDRIDFYAPPDGSSDGLAFSANGILEGRPTTTSGGGWLSVALQGQGSFRFPLPYRITARHLGGMPEGTYNGSIAFTSSAFGPDNKAAAVTLRITSQPIAQALSPALQFRIPQTTAKQTQNVSVINRGRGTLTLGAATVTTATGGAWLTVAPIPGFTALAVTADAANLTPGIHLGSVSIATNAINGAQVVSVRLEVVAQTPPVAAARAVLNNATFEREDPVAQGSIVAVFGEQFTYNAPTSASGLPLPAELDKVRVLVNDLPAKIYFVSAGQINFQIPYETVPGDAIVRVERDGQRGNAVSVRVLGLSPRLLRWPNLGDYGIIVNNDGTLPLPRSLTIPPFASRPAREGDVLVIYVLGFGQTSPPVQSGVAAPSAEPLARVSPTPTVFFGGGPLVSGVQVEPLFAGLTPGFVGLYQVNVVIPPGVPKGDLVLVAVGAPDLPNSNRVVIAIE